MSALVRRSSVLIALCALLTIASSASAKTFTVTKKGDPNPGTCKKHDCSLREAIDAANAHSGKDSVVLPSSKGAYKLSIPSTGENLNADGDLDISGKLALTHHGKGRATVDADHVDRIFDFVTTSPSTISNLEITGGKAVEDGPSTPIPSGGFVDGGSGGGAIRSAATLELKSDLLTRNTAVRSGGAIDLATPATLDLSHSALTHNSGAAGGAIVSGSGKVSAVNSTLSSNRASDQGGAIWAVGKVSLTNSTVSGNKSMYAGGGLYLLDDGAQIEGSTISGNSIESARSGGGIFLNFGDLAMTNSTIANNVARAGGGGIYVNEGTVELNALTIAGNVGDADETGNAAFAGGLYDTSTDAVNVENSIIASNLQSPGKPNDCSGPVTSLGHNVVGTTAGCPGFMSEGDQVGVAAKLGKLGSNGGPTKTISLEKNSPALDKASKTSSPGRDQRGHKRDSKPDIGAFER